MSTDTAPSPSTARPRYVAPPVRARAAALVWTCALGGALLAAALIPVGVQALREESA